jgi:hypothetical protein
LTPLSQKTALCLYQIELDRQLRIGGKVEENDSHRRSRVAIRRRKTHCIDVANASLNRGGEPIGKLLDRVRDGGRYVAALCRRARNVMRKDRAEFHHEFPQSAGKNVHSGPLGVATRLWRVL